MHLESDYLLPHTADSKTFHFLKVLKIQTYLGNWLVFKPLKESLKRWALYATRMFQLEPIFVWISSFLSRVGSVLNLPIVPRFVLLSYWRCCLSRVTDTKQISKMFILAFFDIVWSIFESLVWSWDFCFQCWAAVSWRPKFWRIGIFYPERDKQVLIFDPELKEDRKKSFQSLKFQFHSKSNFLAKESRKLLSTLKKRLAASEQPHQPKSPDPREPETDLFEIMYLTPRTPGYHHLLLK